MTDTSARPEFAEPGLDVHTPRVKFDPNSISRADPRYHTALLEHADGQVVPGQVVLLVVPPDEDDDPEMIGAARVVDVRDGLVYLDVLRESFRESPRPDEITFASSGYSNMAGIHALQVA